MKKKLVTLILVAISFSSMWAQEAMIGEIRLFAGNYAPQGWALCQGQLLNTQQYQALFALLGTTYGGDGITTFALPDLRGRVPVGFGQGTNLTNKPLGEKGGVETVTLTEAQMPTHTHNTQLAVSNEVGTSNTPASGNMLSVPANLGPNPVKTYGNATANKTTISGITTNTSGATQSHNNMMPYTTLNYIIALNGFWPTRP